ncbi:MAG TPA: GGDEF domain-containing protein [Myxococcota bacterium]
MNDTTRIRPAYLLGRDRPPAPPSLVVICGPDLGRRIPLETPTLTIGRDAECDVVVPIDGISRKHCQLLVGEGVRLRDLGSTNGTWLNGREIGHEAEAELRTGDRVELVGIAFKFLDGNDLEAQYHEELYQLAIVDGLTRTFNRRYLMDFLTREISRCRRHSRPLSLLLFDIDRFKEINDRFGHASGDQVLRTIVEVAREGVRREECLARYGGDEFVVVMPETAIEGARIVAERTRGRVEGHGFAFAGREIPVTISVGVTVLSAEMADAEAMLAAADTQLYAAKMAGRNTAAG